MGSIIYYQYKSLATSFKLEARHSVLAAKLYAIRAPLINIEIELPEIQKNYVMFTDSMSACSIIAGNALSYCELVPEIKKANTKDK